MIPDTKSGASVINLSEKEVYKEVLEVYGREKKDKQL